MKSMPDVFISNNAQYEQKNPVDQPVSKSAKTQLSVAEGKPIGLFTAYCENPSNITFASREKDAEVLVFLRAHWITKLPWILFAAILAILPVILNITINTLEIALISIPPDYATIFTLFYYLLIFGYILSNFLTWFYNVLLITTKEIIDLDYSNLVYHDVSATNVNLVEDVNYTVGGFIRSFFNYGDLFVQTAGGKENIEAVAIPKPSIVARIILNLIGRGESSG